MNTIKIWSSILDNNDLRQEIAVSLDDIHAFVPSYHKFSIPVLEDQSSGLSDDDEGFEYYVPYHLTFDWGQEIIPAGTRFIVSFIGGNIQDGRITGRYDRNIETPNPNAMLAQYIIELIELKAREQAIFDYCYDNDTRIRCHHAIEPRDGDVGDMVPNDYPELDYDIWKDPEIDEEKEEYEKGVLKDSNGDVYV